MMCTFSSLPFLVTEAERSSLQRWKRLAVEREKEAAQKRSKRLRELRNYVIARLSQDNVGTTPPPPCCLPPPPPISHLSPNASPPTLTTKVVPSPLPPHSSPPPPHVSPPQPPIKFQLDPLPVQTPRPPTNIHTDPSTVYSTHPPTKFHVEPPAIFPPQPPTENSSGTLAKLPDPTTSKQGRGAKRPPALPSVGVYDKLTALGRGFLTRRLLQAEKVKSLRATIKDARAVLDVLSAQSSPLSVEDEVLKERVLTQLDVAHMTFHGILQLPVGERMVYIAHSRAVREERRRKHMGREGPPSSQARPRLSSATQKLLQRRMQRTDQSHPIQPQGRIPVKLVRPAPAQSKPDRPAKTQQTRTVQSAPPVGQRVRPEPTTASRTRLASRTVTLKTSGQTPSQAKVTRHKSGQTYVQSRTISTGQRASQAKVGSSGQARLKIGPSSGQGQASTAVGKHRTGARASTVPVTVSRGSRRGEGRTRPT